MKISNKMESKKKKKKKFKENTKLSLVGHRNGQLLRRHFSKFIEERKRLLKI